MILGQQAVAGSRSPSHGTKLLGATRAVMMTEDGVAYHERAVRVPPTSRSDGAVASARVAPKGRLRVMSARVLRTSCSSRLPSFQEEYRTSIFSRHQRRHVDLIGDGVTGVRGQDRSRTSMVARKLANSTGDLLGARLPCWTDTPSRPSDAGGRHRVGYFSAASRRSAPLRYARGDEQLRSRHRGLASQYDPVGFGVARPTASGPSHFTSGALVELLRTGSRRASASPRLSRQPVP